MFKVKLYTHCKKSTIVKIEISKFRCRTFKLKKKIYKMGCILSSTATI